MNILVVEDQIPINDSLVNVFVRNNYRVNSANSGEDGLYKALSGTYDIIVLDTLNYKRNGIRMLKSIREDGLTAPVILLSSNGEISDKVTGLDSGADDYMVKPFSVEELLARVRALGRRKNTILMANTISCGDIVLNTNNLTLSTKKSTVKLTCLEGKLLELLLLRKNLVSPKDMLIEKIWGIDSDAFANNVEVYISFLRKKMTAIESKVVINTVRGVGYEIKESNSSS